MSAHDLQNLIYILTLGMYRNAEGEEHPIEDFIAVWTLVTFEESEASTIRVPNAVCGAKDLGQTKRPVVSFEREDPATRNARSTTPHGQFVRFAAQSLLSEAVV